VCRETGNANRGSGGWSFSVPTMNSFWDNIYDDVKDRRYGLLAFVTLLVSIGLLLLAIWIEAIVGTKEFFYGCLGLVPGIALVMAALAWRWIRAARRGRNERLKHSNLSRDELFKARSKLKNGMKPVKFRTVQRLPKEAAPQVRNTDLKY
jgi:hypothetical protein